MSRPKVHVRAATQADVPSMNTIRDLAFMPGPISRAMFRGPVDPETSRIRADEMRNEMADPRYHFAVACLGESPGASASVSFPSSPKGIQSPDIAGGDALAESATIAATIQEPQLSEPPTLEVVDSAIGAEPDLRSNKSGTVVAYVKWAEYMTERPEEEWNQPLDVRRETVGPGIDLNVYETFIGGLKDMRRRVIMGKPHLLLSMLCTSPYHQRLGAGSALVSHVLDRLDSINIERNASLKTDDEGGDTNTAPLDCYLEASPPGYPVYHRLGFKDIDVLDVDLGSAKIEKNEAEIADTRSWGGEYARELVGDLREGVFRTVLMIRSGKEGSRSE